MNKLTAFGLGTVFGIALLGIVGWNSMPKMMLKETPSAYSVEETVQRISATAKEKGWVVASVKPLSKSIAKHGGGSLPPVMLVNLCQAHHAHKILSNDANKIVSVMMPCTISVYEKEDGKTYIGSMNAGLLGTMFGGEVAEVMSGPVSKEQKQFIASATAQ